MSDRMTSVRSRMERINGRHEAAVRSVLSSEEKLHEVSRKLDLQVLVVELLRSLLDVLVRGQAGELADLMTDGCRSVYHDMDLRVEGEVNIERNKVSVQFDTVETKKGGMVVTGDAIDTFGGGVASFQGILVRIYTVLAQSLVPLIGVDEPLSTVSDQYVPLVGSFLRRICEEASIDMLMVTHKAGFQEHAHTIYKSRRRGDETILDKM